MRTTALTKASTLRENDRGGARIFLYGVIMLYYRGGCPKYLIYSVQRDSNKHSLCNNGRIEIANVLLVSKIAEL